MRKILLLSIIYLSLFLSPLFAQQTFAVCGSKAGACTLTINGTESCESTAPLKIIYGTEYKIHADCGVNLDNVPVSLSAQAQPASSGPSIKVINKTTNVPTDITIDAGNDQPLKPNGDKPVTYLLNFTYPYDNKRGIESKLGIGYIEIDPNSTISSPPTSSLCWDRQYSRDVGHYICMNVCPGAHGQYTDQQKCEDALQQDFSACSTGDCAKINYTKYPSPPPPCTNTKSVLDDKGAIVAQTCTSIATPFGNIDTTPQGFVKAIFSLLLGLGGGIAVLIIILNGYKIAASQGNPEAIKGAREAITSAIIGLLFIIFSLVVLQIIGVDILHIPGFISTSPNIPIPTPPPGGGHNVASPN